MHNFHRSLPGSIGLSRLTVFNTRKVFDPGEMQKKTFPKAMSTLQKCSKKVSTSKYHTHGPILQDNPIIYNLLMFHVCRFGTQHFPVSTPSSIHNVKTRTKHPSWKHPRLAAHISMDQLRCDEPASRGEHIPGSPLVKESEYLRQVDWIRIY